VLVVACFAELSQDAAINRNPVSSFKDLPIENTNIEF
jgi:hypothetical protein